MKTPPHFESKEELEEYLARQEQREKTLDELMAGLPPSVQLQIAMAEMHHEARKALKRKREQRVQELLAMSPEEREVRLRMEEMERREQIEKEKLQLMRDTESRRLWMGIWGI